MNDHIRQMAVIQGMEKLEDIYPLIKGRGFVAGSYAAWMTGFTPVKPNDIDIFAVSDCKALALAHAICIQRPGWPMYQNDLLYQLMPCRIGDLPIQIIKPKPEWKIFPDDLIDNFDLSHSRAVLIDDETILGDYGISAPDDAGKFLRINDPLRSLKRALKYSNRGLNFSDWELCKLFRAWESMTPEHRARVIEQAHELEFPWGDGSETDEDEIEERGYQFEEDFYFEAE